MDYTWNYYEVSLGVLYTRLRNERAKHSHEHTALGHEPQEAYVRLKLQVGWSPEQIAGRLPKDHPLDSRMRVSYETIYKFIYAPEQAGEKLWEYLPRKQRKRRKKPGRKVHSSHIPDTVSIHDRPKVVDERKTFGHWEGDTVKSKRSVCDGIHTEVERLSGKLLARRVARITSADTATVQLRMFRPLPRRARRTTTLDNGRENHAHGKLRVALGMQAYFADPYSSWQRGTNVKTPMACCGAICQKVPTSKP